MTSGVYFTGWVMRGSNVGGQRIRQPIGQAHAVLAAEWPDVGPAEALCGQRVTVLDAGPGSWPPSLNDYGSCSTCERLAT